MLLIAVIRQPSSPSSAQTRAAVAPALGLTLADMNQRLAGPLPRILLVEGSPERAQARSAALEQAGFAALTLDPALVPDDQQRIVARRLEISGDALVAFDGHGTPHRCPLGALTLIQRGVRRATSVKKEAVSERRLDVKKALLTGGLLWTSKTDRTVIKTRDTDEAFVLLERGDGAPDLMLYERQLDHRFLGADMLPSSRANLERTLARLCALAPAVPVDQRVGQPGFVTGLPSTAADPLDLALALVTLARRAGA